MAAVVNTETSEEEKECDSTSCSADQNDEQELFDFWIGNQSWEDENETKAEEDERGENESGWGLLPDIILEKIFEHLSIQERYWASMACKQWNRGFHFQRTWNTFKLEDTTLTRVKIIYYHNHNEGCQRERQYVADSYKTKHFITGVGKHIRKLILSTRENLSNLYCFMNSASNFADEYSAEPDNWGTSLFRINTLRFVFWCDMGTRGKQEVYGTGGEILCAFGRLMLNLKHLHNLELIDLHLDPIEETEIFLNEICTTLRNQITSLTLINIIKGPCKFVLPLYRLVNLQVLKISPQHLNDEMIEIFASSYSRLSDLYLVQNIYTESGVSVSSKSWVTVGHKFRVSLRTVGEVDREVIWQEKAPVYSIIYDCPRTKTSYESVLTVIELYSDTLREYGHLGLQKFRTSRKFVNRFDSTLLGLCRRCPYLTSLYIRDRISTSTALLVVSVSPNLKSFILRRNALLKKCDYMFHDIDLDFNFVQWIKLNARSYEKTTREISKMLGFNWNPLSDNEFKLKCRERSAY